MKKMLISLPPAHAKEYPIHIGVDLIEKIASLIDLTKYTKLFVITDQTVEKLFLDKLLSHLPKDTNSLSLPSGESAKDITQLTKLWETMIDAGLDRKSLVINVGGGAISDIGGFAAATYMRGIDFVNMPTTLLAQVDASVGGKTAIDFHGIKNVVGMFYQPSAVIIDITTLKTLPQRALLSGFAEIIKHGLIKDKAYFEKVTSKKPTEFSEEELIEIISQSCEIKAAIVQEDEKENGIRKLVNFGHTIGHAVEALSLETNKALLHGEAISIGMSVEAKLAEQIGLLKKEETKIIEDKIKAAGLPTEMPDFSIENILAKMKSDKKNSSGTINVTLLKSIGEGVIDQMIDDKTLTRILSSL